MSERACLVVFRTPLSSLAVRSRSTFVKPRECLAQVETCTAAHVSPLTLSEIASPLIFHFTFWPIYPSAALTVTYLLTFLLPHQKKILVRKSVKPFNVKAGNYNSVKEIKGFKYRNEVIHCIKMSQ